MRKSKLVDLRVSNVDAVDKPASFQRWAIIKSETESTKDVPALATALIESLVKGENALSDDQVDAVKALAAACDLSLESKPVAKTDEAEPETDEVEETTPDPDEPVTRSMLGPMLKEALGDLLAEELAEVADAEDDAQVEKRAGSRQPDEQDEIEKRGRSSVKKKGDGLFSNVVFGPGTSVGQRS